MIYQMSSGRVIHLSVEQYLDMTDEDIEYMISINYGEYARSPFHGSAVFSSPKKKKKTEELTEEVDKSLDFTEDSEEVVSRDRVVLSEDLPPIETPDLEDLTPEKD